VGKFKGLNEKGVQEMENKLQTMFNMGQMSINYLEPNSPDNEINNSISVSVSFENKEIFENAIKLSKLEENKHIKEQAQHDELQIRGNFNKDKHSDQNDIDFACEEEKLQFSPNTVGEEDGEDR